MALPGTRGFARAAVIAIATAAPLAGCGDGGPTLLAGPTHVVAEADASNPTVAIDGDRGITYVAWVDDVDGPASVWLRSLAGDGTLGDPVRVNDVEGDAAPHFQAPAKVAVGPEGNVYVAWTNATPIAGRPFPASNLRLARSTDRGRTFEPALTVNDDTDGPPASHTFHDLTVLPDGRVVVSWLDSRREWRADAGLPMRHGDPGVEEAPGPDARVAISTDGGQSFGASRIVNTETCPCCRTAMAVGPDGRIHLAWRELFPGDVRDIVVATSTDVGEMFGEPVRVAPDDWVFPGCPHAGPALAVDPAGTLHAAWYTGREDGPGMYYTRSADGGATFEAARPLITTDHVPPSQASMATSENGTTWVVWEDRTLTTPSILVTAVPPGGKPDPDDAHVVPGTYPAMAAAGGVTALTWLVDGGRILLRRVDGS